MQRLGKESLGGGLFVDPFLDAHGAPPAQMESVYAKAALRQFYQLLYAGKVEGCSLIEFQDATALDLCDQDGSLREDLPPITQFLNRILALRIALQNTLFASFEEGARANTEATTALVQARKASRIARYPSSPRIAPSNTWWDRGFFRTCLIPSSAACCLLISRDGRRRRQCRVDPGQAALGYVVFRKEKTGFRVTSRPRNVAMSRAP